jgi:hypothetical protein
MWFESSELKASSQALAFTSADGRAARPAALPVARPERPSLRPAAATTAGLHQEDYVESGLMCSIRMIKNEWWAVVGQNHDGTSAIESQCQPDRALGRLGKGNVG